MDGSPDERVDWDTCDNENCDEYTPWDMLAVIVTNSVFCSPECAAEACDDANADVWLHDPQFTVDRDVLGTDADVVGVQPPSSGPDAIHAIDDVVDATWRV